ncbi:MAG TPA: hypothetical protein DCQ53_09810 [Alphaproteobacteria bacterium]|nr:hypothetical protein [Alphaproteobacteria bacterium]
MSCHSARRRASAPRTSMSWPDGSS